MYWSQQLSSHPIFGAAICLLLAVLMLGLRQLAHRTRVARTLDGSVRLIVLGLLSGALGAGLRFADLAAAVPYSDAALYALLAIGLVRATLTLFAAFYLRQRGGATVSGLVQDVGSVLTYFLVILVVLRTTLDINLASVIATSAVLTVIVGLALQDILTNLFSGLILEMEAPFSAGDWIRVGSFEGVVQEIGWRTTRIRTRLNELVTLPNAMMSKEAVANYSRPDSHFGDTLHFDAAYEAPPNLVKEAVLTVLATEPAVLRVPEAEVRLDQYCESSVKYAIRYWIDDFEARDRIRSRIMTNVWYALRRASIRMPFPARDVFVYSGSDATRVDHGDVAAVLRRVPLLEPLDSGALERLATRARRLTFGKGELVVREGAAGDSFYVIERGDADITLGRDGAARTLGCLHTGDFFGEMSLLAGEPRTATVRAASDLSVIMVDRDAFKEIISADPAILEPLSELAAQRQAAQQEERRLLESTPSEASDNQQAQRLRERIKAFFRL